MATTTVREAAAGDTVAFARIVAAYHADMIRVAYVVAGGDQDLADDAVQAAWSVAWRRLGSLRDPDRLKPWLVSVAANEARQQVRRQRRRTVVEIDVAAVDPAGRDPADRAAELDLPRRPHRRLRPPPTPAPTAASTPDASGWNLVSGVESIVQTETGTTTTADGGQRTTGVVIQATDQASDPRVSGTWTVGLTWQGNASGSLAVEYGTSKMTNAGGTWTGTFSGVGWDGGNASDITLWAVGSGGYAGLSYYVHLRTSYSTGELRGLVFRGSPPAR